MHSLNSYAITGQNAKFKAEVCRLLGLCGPFDSLTVHQVPSSIMKVVLHRTGMQWHSQGLVWAGGPGDGISMGGPGLESWWESASDKACSRQTLSVVKVVQGACRRLPTLTLKWGLLYPKILYF